MLQFRDNETQPKEFSAFFTKEPRQDVSSKYQFVSTAETVEFFRQNGFYISGYSEQGAYLSKNKGKSRHLIRLRPLNRIGETDQVPEIIIVNSHNRYSSLRINIGIYRFACANGMIVGDDFFSEKVTHRGQDFTNQLTKILNMVNYKFNELDKLILNMKRTLLSDSDKIKFVDSVLPIRLSASKYSAYMTPLERQINLTPTRSADIGNDLWSVFNVVQEKIINGGFAYRYDKEGATKRRESSTVKNIVQLEDFNKELFNVAQRLV